MDLSKATPENVRFMIGQIQARLKMATTAAIAPADLTESAYGELKEIYEMVMSKDRFSVSEIAAIASELGRLRQS